jgi:hypothetical protein
MAVFWDVVRWGLPETDPRIWGAYCLHHQDDDRPTTTRQHGATFQKTAIFILVAVRTWNLISTACWNINTAMAIYDDDENKKHRVVQTKLNQRWGTRRGNVAVPRAGSMTVRLSLSHATRVRQRGRERERRPCVSVSRSRPQKSISTLHSTTPRTTHRSVTGLHTTTLNLPLLDVWHAFLSSQTAK